MKNPEKLLFFGLSFLSFALTLSRENRKDMIRINKLKAFIATTLLCSIALSACSSEDKTTTDVITTEDGVIQNGKKLKSIRQTSWKTVSGTDSTSQGSYEPQECLYNFDYNDYGLLKEVRFTDNDGQVTTTTYSWGSHCVSALSNGKVTTYQFANNRVSKVTGDIWKASYTYDVLMRPIRVLRSSESPYNSGLYEATWNGDRINTIKVEDVENGTSNTYQYKYGDKPFKGWCPKSSLTLHWMLDEDYLAWVHPELFSLRDLTYPNNEGYITEEETVTTSVDRKVVTTRKTVRTYNMQLSFDVNQDGSLSRLNSMVVMDTQVTTTRIDNTTNPATKEVTTENPSHVTFMDSYSYTWQ